MVTVDGGGWSRADTCTVLPVFSTLRVGRWARNGATILFFAPRTRGSRTRPRREFSCDRARTVSVSRRATFQGVKSKRLQASVARLRPEPLLHHARPRARHRHLGASGVVELQPPGAREPWSQRGGVVQVR